MVYIQLLIALLNTLNLGARYISEWNPDWETCILILRISFSIFSFALSLALVEQIKESTEDPEKKNIREKEEELLNEKEKEKREEERHVYRDFFKNYTQIYTLFFVQYLVQDYLSKLEIFRDPDPGGPKKEKLRPRFWGEVHFKWDLREKNERRR